MKRTTGIRLLKTHEERAALSQTLGDRPETVIWNHVLRRGNCRALTTLDSSSGSYGAIIQADAVPAEPSVFGSDEVLLWKLLKEVTGWYCVLVDKASAAPLGELITRETGVKTRYLSDINYQLSGEATPFRSPIVRRLTIEDLAVLESSSADLRGGFWNSCQELLSEGIVAGAIVEGRVVSTAIVSSTSGRFSDVGVFTLSNFRNRGLATASASIVAKEVKLSGKIPVWSTGAHNSTSQKLAKSLGFVEVMRRTYVVLETAPGFSGASDRPTDD